MSQNGHTSVHSRGSGAGGTIGLGHSVINPTGSNMNPSSSPSSVSWSHVNNGASVSGPGGNHSVSVAHQQQQQQQQQDGKAVPSPQNSNQSGTTLKEHDLLGLSEVSSTSRESTVQENSLHQDEGNDFEGLNLNMELGPPAARKKADAGFSQPRTPAVTEQQQKASESGNSNGSMDGAQAGAEQGTVLVVDKSSSSPEQSATVSEQGDRGFSYSTQSQGGRADAGGCRPLVDSEMRKWHAEQQGAERKSCNETLHLGISLHSQRAVTQDGLNEKTAFLNSIERNRDTPQELKQSQDLSWKKERILHDVSKMEKTQERVIVAQDQQQQQQVMKKQQQQQLQLERQKQYEPFQMSEKRPVLERNCLPALQQPCSERSPRLPEAPNRMWASPMMFRPTESMVSSTTSYQQHPAQPEMDGSRVGYSVCAGNFAVNRNMYAAPKLGVTGSKRNFDAITGSDARIANDGRIGLAGPSSVSGGSMNSGTGPSSEVEAKALCQQQMKAPSGMQMYPWGQKPTIPSPAWQHIGLEQSGGSFGPFPSSQRATTPGAPMSKNTSEAGPSAGADAKTWDGQPKSHQEIVASSSQKVSAPTDTKQTSTEATTALTSEASAASTPRAPTTAPAAVGWPPLRSVRKSLAVTPRSIPSETPPRQPPAPVAVSTPSGAGQSSNSWFVKVNMDGYPVGRKVDLRNNSSYDKLSQALDDMFRPQFETFLNGQNSQNRISLPSDQKRNFLQGPDFVLTYEDQDGDLMLVGDVPWTMFIDTVKRLRIMKGSEAIGLAGNRGAEKSMKTAQANV